MSETKLQRGKARRLKTRLGFANGLHMDSEGQSGGLMLWDVDLQIAVKNYSRHHIDAFETMVTQIDPRRGTLGSC